MTKAPRQLIIDATIPDRGLTVPVPLPYDDTSKRLMERRLEELAFMVTNAEKQAFRERVDTMQLPRTLAELNDVDYHYDHGHAWDTACELVRRSYRCNRCHAPIIPKTVVESNCLGGGCSVDGCGGFIERNPETIQQYEVAEL